MHYLTKEVFFFFFFKQIVHFILVAAGTTNDLGAEFCRRKKNTSD